MNRLLHQVGDRRAQSKRNQGVSPGFAESASRHKARDQENRGPDQRADHQSRKRTGDRRGGVADPNLGVGKAESGRRFGKRHLANVQQRTRIRRGRVVVAAQLGKAVGGQAVVIGQILFGSGKGRAQVHGGCLALVPQTRHLFVDGGVPTRGCRLIGLMRQFLGTADLQQDLMHVHQFVVVVVLQGRCPHGIPLLQSLEQQGDLGELGQHGAHERRGRGIGPTRAIPHRVPATPHHVVRSLVPAVGNDERLPDESSLDWLGPVIQLFQRRLHGQIVSPR